MTFTSVECHGNAIGSHLASWCPSLIISPPHPYTLVAPWSTILVSVKTLTMPPRSGQSGGHQKINFLIASPLGWHDNQTGAEGAEVQMAWRKGVGGHSSVWCIHDERDHGGGRYWRNAIYAHIGINKLSLHSHCITRAAGNILHTHKTFTITSLLRIARKNVFLKLFLAISLLDLVSLRLRYSRMGRSFSWKAFIIE